MVHDRYLPKHKGLQWIQIVPCLISCLDSERIDDVIARLQLTPDRLVNQLLGAGAILIVGEQRSSLGANASPDAQQHATPRSEGCQLITHVARAVLRRSDAYHAGVGLKSAGGTRGNLVNR